MDAVQMILQLLVHQATVSRARREAIVCPPYDPYSLATRPLPAGLRLHPHPRRISAERARRIIGRGIG